MFIKLVYMLLDDLNGAKGASKGRQAFAGCVQKVRNPKAWEAMESAIDGNKQSSGRVFTSTRTGNHRKRRTVLKGSVDER